MSEVRTGLGWDLHRLAPGRPLILGGVTVPSERGLEGHSGLHFPDSDPRWRGANSLVFLRHALNLASQRGFRLVNVDAIVTLERPKLKDYRQAIRESLATALGVPEDRVSVKFKTAEGIGPVGEQRAAESQAVVTLLAGD